MMSKNKVIQISIVFCFISFILLDLNSGDLPLSWQNIFHGDTFYLNAFLDFRVPRVICAIVTGSALSIAGLLLQTMFNNPLAGPYTLGINSGSSLMVALFLLAGGAFATWNSSIFFAAILGSVIYSIVILMISIKIQSKHVLLLVGVMLASFTSAFIGVLQIQASSESLKSFTIWSMGSLQNATLVQSGWMLLLTMMTMIPTFMLSKKLQIIRAGDSTAISLGVNPKKVRFQLIVITAILTGVATAFCGPIAFIGLAVPNLVRRLLKTSNYQKLISYCFMLGSSIMMLCDVVLQFANKWMVLPVNTLTAIIGAPVVISILLKTNRRAGV